MDDDQQFCLRWNNHQSTLISVFDTLLENETLVDCTLAAEGKFLKAHKVVLSACSPYFATLLQEQYDKHPIFILKDVKYQELRAMMDYMYRGEVNISQDQLAALLKAAESLQIKGLSDNRTGGGVPKHEQPQQQHRGLGGLAASAAAMGAAAGGAGGGGGKHVAGGYTLVEQSKRARLGPASIDSQELSGSREGSSSPTSRRRRRVRRRSIENTMTEAHDNSNSSQIQPIATTSALLQQQQQQSNASLGGVGAITAAASALASQVVPASAAAALPTAAAASTIASNASNLSGITQQQQLTAAATASVTKKTEGVKGSSGGSVAAGDAMHSELLANIEEQQQQHAAAAAAGLELKTEKQNHKQKSVLAKEAASSASATELVIEPKSEYDDEGNDENVEDLTLDDEDMGMEDLDHNAGTSHGNEGSSQGYAQWQHDRSQDEVYMGTQEAQQRDPQVKHDKSEQTDISPDDFELDDCLLESNDIVITQNKDGFVLHVKKLGNITTAKIAAGDEDQSENTVSGSSHQSHMTEVQEVTEVKPTLTTLTASQAIKLPSSECELINLKKIIPAATTITHHPHATTTIIQPHQLQHHHQHQQQQQQQHQQQQQQHLHQQHQQQHHIQLHDTTTTHHHQQQQHEVQQQQHIVTTAHPQTINLMSLRNVQITEQKPMISRIKYSRGKIITQPGATSTQNVQIVEAHDQHHHQQQHHHHHQQQQHHHQSHELTEGTKYEISEIDLNNAQTSAAIISDLVKYAEIDDIELPDGTKIGIGFAPTEMTEHMQQQTTQLEEVEQVTHATSHHHHHQQHHHLQITPVVQSHHIQHQQTQQQTQQQHLQTLEQEEEEEDEPMVTEGITVQEHPTITKSYTILTTRPMKQESGTTTTTTYELSLSDSSLGQADDIESKYVCRHCGKKYRWKSTLRRHESVECGGKEPCHPCPHCSYKAKQRGNLGVHVRKHHPDKPQLESKRGRKI